MISITVENIPTVREDFTEQFALIGEYMLGSIRQNFVRGGRPSAWSPLKRGGASFLFQTGRLLNSGDYDYGPDEVTVRWGGGVPYAFAHQYGYSPRNLPARPFVIFQEEDIEWIKELMSGSLLEYGDVTNPRLSQTMD